MARTKDLPASEPSSYTLLFKNGRATILLLVPPQTPFPTIMTDLLEVLQERYPNGLPASKPHDPAIPIPDSTEDMVFGIPLDPYEPSKGWQELDTAGVTATPKERELKDGSILAFAFVKEGEDVEFNVEWSSYDEAAVEGDDDDEQ